MPTANAPSAGKPAPAITGWSTTTAAAAPAPVVAATAAAAQCHRTPLDLAPAPTEGRMALAGPLDDPTLAGAAPPLAALPACDPASGPSPAPPKAVAKGRLELAPHDVLRAASTAPTDAAAQQPYRTISPRMKACASADLG